MENKPRYGIMDISYKKLIIEGISDEAIPIIKTVVKTFYHRQVGDAINNYREARFAQIQDRFAKEEEILSHEQIKDFYNSIDEEKMDLLFDLLDKARATAYNLHAKLLSKLYGNFIRKGKLYYEEKTLLANINTLNDEDLIHFCEVLKYNNININEPETTNKALEFKIKSYSEYYMFEKLERAGLIIEKSSNVQKEIVNLHYSRQILKNKNFHIHSFSLEIFNFLESIFTEKETSE
ncbi:hypothetical protein [Aliarcobacter cryaerophilus]|uniref:hypothetical protein n=1 Tax=Aliarcobacter cryaerophilus TaxID=28198 RepID=UPI00112F3210|nr:hypothetical protein [Aliarcobacter cryaerophilus]